VPLWQRFLLSPLLLEARPEVQYKWLNIRSNTSSKSLVSLLSCSYIGFYVHIFSVALFRYLLEEQAYQTVMPNQMEEYLGDERGIQGHQNSCYLDSTVFGLFALSDSFDSMFLKPPTNSTQQEVSSILWKHIVNPLRK